MAPSGDPWRRVQLGLALLLTVIVLGTVGYLILGLSPLDSLYQTVTTISTVGFREMPADPSRPFRVFTTGQNAFSREGIEHLESIGVTDVIIGFRNVYEMEEDKPLAEKVAMLNWYAGEFISG